MQRLLLVVLMIVACQASAQESGRVVRASAFVLENDQGQIRAVLRIAAGDAPALILYDEKGNKRIDLGMLGDFTWISIADGNENLKIDITTGGPPSAQEAVIQIQNGNRVVEIGADSDNTRLRMWDKNGKVRLGVILSDQAGPGIIILNETERWIWSAPMKLPD